MVDNAAMIKVSIIVPIYNSELYLEECLDSLVTQTLSGIEIICVDDASPDDSYSIVKRYADRFQNIRIIRHNMNQGLSVARNSGIDVAKGKYVMFADSDDYLAHDDACEKLFGVAEENETDIVYYAFKKLNKDGSFSEVLNDDHLVTRSGAEMFCVTTEEHRNRVESWAQFYKRKFLEDHSMRFLPNLIHEDVLFYFYSAMLAQRVIEINDIFYVYRQRDGSIMSSPMSEIRVKSYFMIVCKIFEYWTSHSFSERENHEIADFLFAKVKMFLHTRELVGLDDKNWSMGYPEEFMYRVARGAYNCEMIKLSEGQIRQISNAKRVVIYGVGVAAEDIVDTLIERNIAIDLAVVSHRSSEMKRFHDIEIREIGDIENDARYIDAIFIIATTQKFHGEIEATLRNVGFYNILRPIVCD